MQLQLCFLFRNVPDPAFFEEGISPAAFLSSFKLKSSAAEKGGLIAVSVKSGSDVMHNFMQYCELLPDIIELIDNAEDASQHTKFMLTVCKFTRVLAIFVLPEYIQLWQPS